MGHIIALAFASAGSLVVQLIAVVLVILTRPRPKPLLWAFLLSALIMSVGTNAIVLAIFRAKGTLLGTTSKKVSPGFYVLVGVIALAVAAFAATRRGRELLGRELDKQRQKSDSRADSHSIGGRVQARVQDVKTRGQEALAQGSVWVAIVAGVVLGAPTPYSLAAVGLSVRDGYGLLAQLLLIVLFSLITYLLVELPILSYAIKPEATKSRVESFAGWLGTHKIQAAAAVAAVVGIALIAKGVTAL